MTTYQQYPTPPLTSSPKQSANYQAQPQAYDYDYPDPSPFTQLQGFPPQPQSSAPPPPQIPAQDSYFHSYSAPSSPIHDVPQYSSQRPPKPIRRRSSPLIGPGGVPYSQASPRPYSPSGLHRLSPRPLHYSPSNPVPSPYSAGRPKPRPGFLKRIAMKVEAWIKGFMRWSKKNPMIAGVLTFVPVMTIAAVVKIARVAGKGLGLVEKGFGRPPKIGEGAGNRDLGDEWGWGMDEFKGFGGSKGGPFDELLKVLQMLV